MKPSALILLNNIYAGVQHYQGATFKLPEKQNLVRVKTPKVRRGRRRRNKLHDKEYRS